MELAIAEGIKKSRPILCEHVRSIWSHDRVREKKRQIIMLIRIIIFDPYLIK